MPSRRVTLFISIAVTAAFAPILAACSGSEDHDSASKREFDRVRPQFAATVDRLYAEPGRTYESQLEFSSIRIEHVYDNSAGEVYFHEEPAAGARLGHNPGWAYSPTGFPRGFGPKDMTDLGDGWYRFTNVTTD
ncbi:hypothetical protein [Nocardia sp. NPDC058705]|uniref:hypothetical protein n=1 Tax=Nocardia sp. NPDC058705 TaxID=3346609 RepID=UPI003693B976